MQIFNAVAIARLALRNGDVLGSEIEFGTATWFIYGGLCCFLVLFAGLMSGLTLGLMSINLVDLEILKRSGSSSEQKQAAAILPVVQKQHQLLVTLLLCNAGAMEALPIYLDKLFNQYLAIILSVTLVLAFGEVIPQAICSRYGLAVGANFVWLVRILMIVSYPISYPIGKVLDWVLGHDEALFRRAQLKALVSIHGQEAGKGGELTHDETTIINGALDLTEKTAQEAMTPIDSTFSLDVNAKLDWEAMGKILARGHSRVPVYSGTPKNIIGLLLVKTLLTVRPETETPVSAVTIRKVPRVPADMPLYDILNEFQKGHSHMAVVVKAKSKSNIPLLLSDDKESGHRKITDVNSNLSTPLLPKQNKNSESVVDIEKINGQTKLLEGIPSSMLYTPDEIEEGEVVGIITLEDVFEELLQEEIVDETDEFIDVHRRIRVAAVAAASSVARAPSVRRLTSQKAMIHAGANKQGQSVKKPSEDDAASSK
ncbi:DUF21 domain-containing protein At4g14240-like [Silene latifolia]|uniref:DUF21 domain-containing protein At4g14240-like n=1 Tax=Silene latifolia TaxID=37657 RepID=UPI003D787278